MMWSWWLAAGIALLLAMPAQATDRLLGKRDFERAAVLYGGGSIENLEGRGCGHRLYVARPAPPSSAPTNLQDPWRCRLKFSPDLDVPFQQFPVAMFFDRRAFNGASPPPRPQDMRGVYIYRFDAGKLVNDGSDIFRTQSAEPGAVLKVRAGEVVTWSMIVSNVEYDAPHDSIPLREILVTPVATRIHHCSVSALNGCDPLNVRAASFGLCDGRVRLFDGRGGLQTTSTSHFQPMGGTRCEAIALIDDGDRWLSVFHRFHRMPQGLGSVASAGNSWQIEPADPPGAYRIDVRLSGKLVGQLVFEVVR